MSIFKIALIVFTLVFLSSCSNPVEEEKTTVTSSNETSLTDGEKLIQEAISAHGGDLFSTAHYSFEFRGKTYEFKNNKAKYTYTKTYEKEDSVFIDVYQSGSFSRTVNGQPVLLSDKEKASGESSVNSVIYFATLPYKLSDKSVNAKQKESVSIKGEKYDVLEVTFDEVGGGEDHEDTYYYWINKTTRKIDYLAYNYIVNDGGVRFRSAFNKRVVDGITFQDYINFGATVGTPLKDLPALYEAGELKELSQIKTENVINLNKQ